MSSSDDSLQPDSNRHDLDQALDQTDTDRLAAVFQQEEHTLSPPFYNCFSNTFANSPNFAKRLARAPQALTQDK